MIKEESSQIEIGGQNFPIKIVSEFRKNARVSLGSKEVLLRVPNFPFSHERNRVLSWARDYLEQLYVKKPSAFYKYIPVDYSAIKSLSIMDQDLAISIKRIKSQRPLRVLLEDNRLQIELNSVTSSSDPAVGKAVADAIRKSYLPMIAQKVNSLNRSHLNEPLGRVSLRHNSTRWGSCSTRGNISISTRSLLAPQLVLDYIIIHELCHLKEMNHSSSFWDLVESIDPSYKEKERWLRKNGQELRF